MPLAPSDQLSFNPAGVVNPLFRRGVVKVTPTVGLGEVRAGVEKRGGRGPEAFPWAATFAAARFNSSRKDGG
jgi:hypothetical protein